MTNYSKWDKLAAELPSDTESEEERELSDYTRKETCYIHIPPKEFTQKTQLCKLLEEDPQFEAPSSAAAGVVEDGDDEEPNVSRAKKKYGWGSIGSQMIPGYGSTCKGEDHWRVFFDDCFLTTQKTPNPGARALLGYASLGSFVVACLDGRTGKDRPISRKEVADLILKRQKGEDAERINVEHEARSKSMKEFEKLGAQCLDLKPDT